MVERNLAKVEVASSNLVSRSNLKAFSFHCRHKVCYIVCLCDGDVTVMPKQSKKFTEKFIQALPIMEKEYSRSDDGVYMCTSETYVFTESNF